MARLRPQNPDFASYLQPGEALVAVQFPSFRQYVRRELVVLALTFLLALPVIVYFADPLAWLILPFVLLTDLFVLDTFTDWQRQRNMVWLITNRRLIEIDRTDPLDPKQMYLAEITRLRTMVFWRLMVVDCNAQVIDIGYPHDIGQLRAQLSAGAGGLKQTGRRPPLPATGRQ